MNNGNVLKKIFTIGDLSASASEAFVRNWKYGWVEHFKLPNYLSNFKDQDGFFSLFLIDSDMASLSLFQTYIAQLKNTDDYEVIAIAEKRLTSEQLQVISVIDESLRNSHVKIVCQSSLSSVLECYAHLLCGFSISCLDFNDLHEWLHAGTKFVSVGAVLNDAVKNELPYMLYLNLTELKAQYEKSELEIAAVNVVFLGAYISQDLLSASLTMLSGFFHRDLPLSFHSNIHDLHQIGKMGFRIFASLKMKAFVPNCKNEITAFLRE